MILKHLLAICACISFFALNSQSKNPITDYQLYIENPEIIGENKLDARASFTSYTSEKRP